MWSPELHSVRIAVASAAWPVAQARALDRRHALFEHRHGRVGDARVDVAEGLQVEQRRGVLGGVEHERRGLVDRRGARARGRIGNLPGVQAKRLDAELAIRHWF